VLLVSTQLIEAGVDVDFPVVFRALAPADSLQQAAGRANREGRRPEPGRVVVFAASDASAPPTYRALVEATKPLFGPGLADPDDLQALERYYRRLYSALNLDEGERGTKIQTARHALDFRAVADGPLIDPSEPGRNSKLAFRMIDDETTPVVATGPDAPGVPGAVPELLDQLRPPSRPRREVFRAAAFHRNSPQLGGNPACRCGDMPASSGGSPGVAGPLRPPAGYQ
jgi:CRISPR-associated endonuclease/helicase Cas3